MITYERAVQRLKSFESRQRRLKRSVRYCSARGLHSKVQKLRDLVESNAKDINVLLSLIFYAKAARKMYYQIHIKGK